MPEAAVAVVGDFDGDGRDDVLWYGPGPAADVLWVASAGGFEAIDATMDEVVEPAVGDFDGDGRDDVLWHRDGATALTLWSGRPAGGFEVTTLGA